MNYFSDSGGVNIFKKLSKTNLSSLSNIQILTHPIWWTIKSNSPTETLNKWLKKSIIYNFRNQKKL